MTALISIIVPCYNQAQYLDECLQSVYNQSFQEWECVIVDDGSPDNTEVVARRWTVKDCRFKYFKKQNEGVCAARNYGIERAIGQWILPVDSDNSINQDYLLEASKYFDKNFKVIYGNARKYGAINEDWILPPFTRKKMAVYNIIDTCAFYKKIDFNEIGGYDEQMIHGLEDWEFWINLLKDGGDVKHLPAIHFNYRVQEKSRTAGLDMQKFEKMVRYIERKHTSFFHENLGTFHQLAIENLDLKSKVNGKVYKLYMYISKILRRI